MSERAGLHPIRWARLYVRSWRMSRAIARDPQWQHDIAEADAAWADFVARGYPEDELVTLDELRERHGIE